MLRRVGLFQRWSRSFSSASQNEKVRSLLKNIKDERGQNIEGSGMLHSIDVDDKAGRVLIKLQLTKDFRKIKSLIQNSLKKELEWVKIIEVDLAPKPREAKSQSYEGLSQVKQIFAVSSCKGGVGKSTVAVNLAYSMLKMGLRVGILDADIYGPSLPTMISPKQPRLYADTENSNLIAPVEFGGIKIVSYGFAAANRRAVMRGPMVSQLIKQLATQTNWGDLDALVVDFPPGTGDIQITLCQELPLKGAVIVTTPQRLSFVDVVKGIEMFDELKVPTLAVVQNMAYFQCSDCSEIHFPFGKGYTEQLKSQFGIQNSFQLPIEPKVSKYSDQGTPFVTVLPDSLSIVKVYSQIAEKVIQEAQEIQKVEEPSISYNPKSGSVEIKTKTSSRVISARQLRLGCKCALCVEEMTGIKRLKQEHIPQTVYPLNIIQKGNYAVAVVWSDGHNSSLYPYSRLLNQEEFRSSSIKN